MAMHTSYEMSDLEPYSYVLVHFKEDPNGYAERIYVDVAQDGDPTQWLPLNAGQPILTSHLGTTGVRDPHIIRHPNGTWYIIATDLRVFGEQKGVAQGGDWYSWSHHGSTSLIVWSSPDLVHFSDPHMFNLAQPTNHEPLELGMAWACECLWEESLQTFVIYWSSKLFDPSDNEHMDDSIHDCVLWGTTTDFTQDTYCYGGVLIDTGGDSIDTTMIQRCRSNGGMQDWSKPNDHTCDGCQIDGDKPDSATSDNDKSDIRKPEIRKPDGEYIDADTSHVCKSIGSKRTYRITKDNSFGRGIWMDYTDDQQWWLPNAQWHTIQERIGAAYADNANPSGVEGPAVFADINGKQWYLFVDVIPSVGYRPMVSSNLDEGFTMLQDEHFKLAGHTKHGGVAHIDRATYDALLEAYPPANHD